jgi:DNA-binding MarR family transcriptional regulator
VAFDLTDALATALWRLDPGQPPPSMRDLAATLDCDPSTVTFLVDRLEERGLIARRPAAGDRRRKVITLTTQGVATRRKLIDTLSGCSPLAALSLRDQRQLSDLLARAGADPGSFTCRADPDRRGPLEPGRADRPTVAGQGRLRGLREGWPDHD